MEEGIDELLFNKTLVKDIGEGYFKLKFAALIVICIIGLISATIMIIAISANKSMHTRTNLLLRLYLICDVVLLLSTPQFISRLVGKSPDVDAAQCLIDMSDFILQIFEMAIMMVLLSNSIMQTEKITDRNLIVYMCVAIGICTIVSIVLCGYNSLFPTIYALLSLSQLILLIAMVAKDIYTCFKAKTHPLSDDQKFRLGVVRIYIYIMFVVTMLMDFSYGWLGLSVYMFVYLTPMFIMMYAYWADQRYKICIMNLFRKKENRRSIDARIGFAEVSSVNEGEF